MDEPYVFISYKTEDFDRALLVRQGLRVCGYQVWWSEETHAGEDWKRYIIEKLKGAACVVVLWTKQACASGWVQQEAALARDAGKLVPVLLDSCAVPEPHRETQCAMLQDWSGRETHPEFQKLVRIVKDRIRAAYLSTQYSSGAADVSPASATQCNRDTVHDSAFSVQHNNPHEHDTALTAPTPTPTKQSTVYTRTRPGAKTQVSAMNPFYEQQEAHFQAIAVESARVSAPPHGLTESGQVGEQARNFEQPSEADPFISELTLVYKALANDPIIPVLGSGIYGDGPLGLNLVRALVARMQVKHRPSVPPQTNEEPPPAEPRPAILAEITEFLERYYEGGWDPSRNPRGGTRWRNRSPGRLELLKLLLETLETQSRNANSSMHDIIVNSTNIRLVISTTYDWELETQLQTSGRSHVVVSHVIHAAEGRSRGKILISRPEEEPVLRSADEVDIRRGELIIYKLMGSPLIGHPWPADSTTWLDTVVATEGDHATLMAHLEHQKTKVPQAFSRLLKQGRFLFAGYGLDVWHYRLIMRGFRQFIINRRQGPYSVRRRPTEQEELYWKRLGAEMIPLEPEPFSQQFLRSGAL